MKILLSLAAAMAVGLAMTRVVKKIHLPNVTGYLIAGLLVGPYCLNWVGSDSFESLSIITSVALGFIAFSIGGEFKLSHIRQIGSRAIVITCFEALTAVVLVGAALILFRFPLPLALTLAAIAAATAPAATLMVVRQYKAKGPVTSTLLPVVAMDDAVCLMAYAICSAIARTLVAGQGMTVWSMFLQPVLEIVESLAVGFSIGFVLTVCLRFFKSRANRLSLMVASVFLGTALADLWGLSSLLVCMMIGAAMVNLSAEAEAVMEGCDRWTPPLFMIFFVISGAELDLGVVPSVGLLGVLYLVFRTLGKYMGAYIGSALTHAAPAVRKYLGVTLLPQAGVAIGMAQLAMTELPEYGPSIRAVILCGTLIYELVGPVLTKIFLTKAGEIPQKEGAPKFAGKNA